MKAESLNSHILLSNKKTEKVKTSDVVLTSSVDKKLLGITLDSELKSEKRITDICNKASQKLHVLPRITSYMSLNKRRLLMKSFVESQLIIPFQSGCFTPDALTTKTIMYTKKHLEFFILIINQHFRNF